MTLEQAASVAQLVIAAVAMFAFGSAVYGILDQRAVARKRAALDLFLKTELDKAMVETYEKYDAAIGCIRADTSMAEFAKTPEYRLIRSVLNIHELVSVGVRKNVLDEDVCFDFWSDELMDAYRNCKRVIEHARVEPKGTQFTYKDLERLNESWVKRHKNIAQRQRP